MHQYDDTRYKTGSLQVDRRALAIFEDASKLVGLDEPKKEVIQLLAEDGEPTKQQPPKVVAIVGSGGLGKTTLAYRVYQELKRGFDCSVFLSVSQNPDIIRVLSNILSLLNQDNSAAIIADLPQLITKIRDFLKKKRYCFRSFKLLPREDSIVGFAKKINHMKTQTHK